MKGKKDPFEIAGRNDRRYDDMLSAQRAFQEQVKMYDRFGSLHQDMLGASQAMKSMLGLGAHPGKPSLLDQTDRLAKMQGMQSILAKRHIGSVGLASDVLAKQANLGSIFDMVGMIGNKTWRKHLLGRRSSLDTAFDSIAGMPDFRVGSRTYADWYSSMLDSLGLGKDLFRGVSQLEREQSSLLTSMEASRNMLRRFLTPANAYMTLVSRHEMEQACRQVEAEQPVLGQELSAELPEISKKIVRIKARRSRSIRKARKMMLMSKNRAAKETMQKEIIQMIYWAGLTEKAGCAFLALASITPSLEGKMMLIVMGFFMQWLCAELKTNIECKKLE